MLFLRGAQLVLGSSVLSKQCAMATLVVLTHSIPSLLYLSRRPKRKRLCRQQRTTPHVTSGLLMRDGEFVCSPLLDM